MSQIRERFLNIVKSTPCLVCGRYGVDIAHVRPWSSKLGRLTRRTHKGVGWFYAVPLCRKHHLEQGQQREEVWFESNVDGGLHAVYFWIAKTLAELCESDESIQRILGAGTVEALAEEAHAIIQTCLEEGDSQ